MKYNHFKLAKAIHEARYNENLPRKGYESRPGVEDAVALALVLDRIKEATYPKTGSWLGDKAESFLKGVKGSLEKLQPGEAVWVDLRRGEAVLTNQRNWGGGLSLKLEPAELEYIRVMGQLCNHGGEMYYLFKRDLARGMRDENYENVEKAYDRLTQGTEA